MGCIHQDHGCAGNLCDGAGQWAPDDKCYNFVSDQQDQYHCSRMNAFCPKAPTCYGENVEYDDSSCSQGMVLCTAVDDESDRVMYDIEDLKFLDDKNNGDEIPF